jgi:hypothetical protein
MLKKKIHIKFFNTNRSVIALVTILLLGASFAGNSQVLKSIYTLPCGPNNYTIIPVAGNSNKPPYTLLAADSTTVIAGPQTSNVFPNITGIAGDIFYVTLLKIIGNTPIGKKITLNAGTSVINGSILCPCTLGIPPVCVAMPGADSITGAFYDWTSPGGIHFYQSGFVAQQQPPENGLWTVSAAFSASGCNYILTNSFTLSGCGSPVVPIKYNYVRAGSSYCKVKAEWSTAQEENSDRFEIEMSVNGITEWYKVATVAAAGHSSTDHAYSAEFPAGNASILFIRLKQIDLDGHFTYSIVVKVNTGCNSESDLLSVIPGVVQQNSNILIKLESSEGRGKGYIVFSDVAGRQFEKIAVTINKSFNQYNFSTDHFTRGVNFVKLVSAAGNWQSNTVKFIVQ